MKTFSIEEVIRFGWAKTKENYSKVFTVMLALLFINLSMNFLNRALNLSGDVSSISLLFGFTLLGFLIIEIIVVMNIIKQGLIVVRGGKADAKKLLDYPDEFFKYIIGQLLAGVIIVVGFLLLIIPGVIVALMLCFTKPVLVDLKLGPIEAIKKCMELTKGHLWELFTFFIAIVLMNIVGVIFLVIGLFVTVPITFFAMLYLYDKFLNLNRVPVNNPEY